MAKPKLKQLKPRIATIGAAIRAKPQQPRSTVRYPDVDRSFKKTARWQRLRWDVLVRDNFTCQWAGCGITLSNTSELVADHIVPVRVAPERKWDMDNLQCLCKACHDGPKQTMEIQTYGPAETWEGGVKSQNSPNT